MFKSIFELTGLPTSFCLVSVLLFPAFVCFLVLFFFPRRIHEIIANIPDSGDGGKQSRRRPKRHPFLVFLGTSGTGRPFELVECDEEFDIQLRL